MNCSCEQGVCLDLRVSYACNVCASVKYRCVRRFCAMSIQRLTIKRRNCHCSMVPIIRDWKSIVVLHSEYAKFWNLCDVGRLLTFFHLCSPVLLAHLLTYRCHDHQVWSGSSAGGAFVLIRRSATAVHNTHSTHKSRKTPYITKQHIKNRIICRYRTAARRFAALTCRPI